MFSVVLFISLVLPAFPQEKGTQSYQQFLDEAVAAFRPVVIKANDDYRLGNYSWYLDQGTGKLTFSEDGVVKVIAEVQIVGSYSTYSRTWKWAWANPTIDAKLKKEIVKVKEFGERRNYKELTTAILECDEDYPVSMMAAAGHLLKAKGAYRGPIEDGYVYMIFTDIRWASQK